MGLGFVQDRREVVQRLEKGRHRRLVIERDIGWKKEDYPQ